ncbi:putative glucuronosyltransferase PGSIP8 [Macadamia integrifolia]|uniref:putative glucuronosyltransferase PGSIP8 n=1 Tax=Macadamia integrifolia TaxID=60698 RepID=UPI001C4F260E|nr:putative glucuronosyltransferase PGSIP8 [Macadamia integrifolia]
MGDRDRSGGLGSLKSVLFVAAILAATVIQDVVYAEEKVNRNAYAAMMYMGTPRDYEFYVATRVMLRSLAKLQVDADLVVIASLDVPVSWVQAMEQEDGIKVKRVENLHNPYQSEDSHDRFKLTMNKFYAWSLVDYDRVVMLDADNLILQKTDELFQCGQFCAVFINPCIFHTGLFVLQPSNEVFKDMLHELDIKRHNPDGADQGFLGSYFPDLLDRPMFHPPSNGTKLEGIYRLPLGYQMDASYYYLKLRWNVPCGPNSVITFPSAPWLKPWYWWSWPVLPLGFQWHEQRRQTLGYNDEVPMVLILSTMYLAVMALTRLARPNLSKFCYRKSDKSLTLQTGVKMAVVLSILAAYTIPFFVIPCTVHPIVGWTTYFFGCAVLASLVIHSFQLPALAVLTPALGIAGVLFVMAYPGYKDGIVRALAVFSYAFCFAPVLCVSLAKVAASLPVSIEREFTLPRVGESQQPSGFFKLY